MALDSWKVGFMNELIRYPSLPSKDELVAEWLRYRGGRFWQRWATMSKRHPDNPGKRLKSAFALLAKHVTDPATLGCGMANAMVATADSDHPARQAIEAHKAKLRASLAALCVGSGAAEPERLAVELFLLMEGAQSTPILGVQAPARDVGPAAASLIDSRLAGEKGVRTLFLASDAQLPKKGS